MFFLESALVQYGILYSVQNFFLLVYNKYYDVVIRGRLWFFVSQGVGLDSGGLGVRGLNERGSGD